MSVPEKYRRCPTRAAIDSLAERFGFSNVPNMQDWELEVADASRTEEFLRALETDDLTEDERFTLTETVMAGFDELAACSDLAASEQWHRFARLLLARPSLHCRTLYYWARLDAAHPSEEMFVSPLVRRLWAEVQPQIDRAL